MDYEELIRNWRPYEAEEFIQPRLQNQQYRDAFYYICEMITEGRCALSFVPILCHQHSSIVPSPLPRDVLQYRVHCMNNVMYLGIVGKDQKSR